MIALRAPLAAVLAAAAVLLVPAAGALHADVRAAAALNGLKVTGHRITDASGKPVMLRGVNRSGTEYACQQGWGIFDGPADAASVQAMTTWHINYVRVLLNEDCWLDINGIDPSLAGTNYQTAIKDYVDLLNGHGIYVELSLIFASPGTHPADHQPAAPSSHSVTFWGSVAAYFKNFPNVFFGVWGEPAVDASCWLNGCGGVPFCTDFPACSTYITYTSSGSQALVTAIRNGGATQIISVPGINYANDLSQWLTYEPNDPLGQLIAEEHVYGDNDPCGAATALERNCLNTNTATLAATVPVIFGETGETVFSTECGSSNMQFLLPWADAHNIGYAAWVWDAWSGDCLSLITDYYNGIPNTTDPAGTAYAQYIHDHLLAVTAGRTVAQAPTSTPGGRGTKPSASATPPPRLVPAVQVAPRSVAARIAISPRALRMPPGFYRALTAA
ncbi:MAG TPA: cellulase family glycosylhydrolase [Candidatus Dormibacteraeota bacterium]|nr:cellulase family glycosylhydrolase [Candidatus Dormibacteraeota bacterium]